jgi:hypothetical protein
MNYLGRLMQKIVILVDESVPHLKKKREWKAGGKEPILGQAKTSGPKMVTSERKDQREGVPDWQWWAWRQVCARSEWPLRNVRIPAGKKEEEEEEQMNRSRSKSRKRSRSRNETRNGSPLSQSQVQNSSSSSSSSSLHTQIFFFLFYFPQIIFLLQ